MRISGLRHQQHNHYFRWHRLLPSLSLLFVWLGWLRGEGLALSPSLNTAGTQAIPVLVTGASGRTGQLVLNYLLSDSRFEPKAWVRNEKSAKKLRKSIPGIGLDQIIVCDVTTLRHPQGSSSSSSSPPLQALRGITKAVICTSAVPRVSKRSLLGAVIKAPFNVVRGRKPIDFRSFRFRWQAGQYPELVDYYGQIDQIELLKAHGVTQIVLLSSMGGTNPDNFLNSVGKRKNGSGHGDILLWKRQAELHLVQSGLDYVIIHPGGLTDDPAGQRDYLLDVDDRLMEYRHKSISRADVARLCVAALTTLDGEKLSLDCISQPVPPGGTIRSPEEALQQFAREGKIYNYVL